MVWGCFSTHGAPKIVAIEGTLGSVTYCAILEEFLLPYAKDNYDENLRFQSDNAAVHTSAHTKLFFFDEKIDVLEWPSRSTDLNPIENLWGYLVTEVYKEFRQFDDTEILIEAFGIAWENLDPVYLKKLVRSMPRR